METQRQERLFTLPEAQATLPLVSTVMKEAVACWEKIQKADLKYDSKTGETIIPSGLKEQSDRFCRLVDEIREVGAVIHQIDERTVHFHYMNGVELGYLCWRVGEENISHFHTDDQRCEKRSPIGER